jgi:DNA-directed RNA polymerase specialized sigma24 family protein
VTISFWDLHRGIKELSPRKREALFYNVILDEKQRDVADRMGITTVSVGQYVEQAVMQLAEQYFTDEED